MPNKPVATVRLVLKAFIVSFAFLNSNSKTKRKRVEIILISKVTIRYKNVYYFILKCHQHFAGQLLVNSIFLYPNFKQF